MKGKTLRPDLIKGLLIKIIFNLDIFPEALHVSFGPLYCDECIKLLFAIVVANVVTVVVVVAILVAVGVVVVIIV